MKTKYRDKVHVNGILPRKDAEKLLSILKKDKRFEDLVDFLEVELAPIYIHQICCCGCGKLDEVGSRIKLTKEQIKQQEEYHLCGPCYDSEDFK